MPAHTKPWFRSCDLHTQSFMQASSAISFRLLPGSISAAASSGSPLPSSFLSGFSGPSIPRLSSLPFGFLTPAVFAFFRPLQFWVLTTQPLFLPFLLFPVPSHSGFPGASFRFRFQIFHFLFRLVSRASHPASSTQLSCMFPFTLPRFAPTAVPQVLTFRSRFRHFPFRFRSTSGYSA